MPRLVRQSSQNRENRCPICGTSITWYEARSKITCSDRKCFITHRKKQNDRRYRRNLARATAYRNKTAARLGVQSPESFRPIVTSVNTRPIVPLSRKRRYRSMNMLIRLVESSVQDVQHDLRSFEDDQQSPPIFAIACANCRGNCCLLGGTQAHLDKDAIRHFASIHPGAKVRDIIEAYSRSQPHAIFRDSCVFHSANGCSLPRNMRSATCLNTICGGLVELRQRIELDGESRFFLAAVNKNGVVRGRFEIC